MAPHILYYNAFASDIIMLDVLKNPMLSDVSNALHINGISLLIHIDLLLLSIDIINWKLTD
jgi:hypothetical protein